MSKSNPTTENWTVDDELIWTDANDEGDPTMEPVFLPGPLANGPRARLAAAAPELMRALMAVEFVDGKCPWCRCWESSREKNNGHSDCCVRLNVLREAGLNE